MTMIRLVVGAALLLAAGCYEQTPQPQYPQPEEVSGPPGGAMDQPTYSQYEADSQPAQSAGYSQPYSSDPGYAPDDSGQQADPEPSADPQDPGYAMGPVNDAEIDSTLQPYGEWVDDADYGRVWRPYATVVGADFTPYQSCGQWIWTDWGWSYSCDWDWGWLPFHYGRWDWFDDGYWGWVPGYEWGPGWVDWRNGGGYVGWRPSAPEIHDHRGGNFHDHRHGMHDAHWAFTAENDFGKGHIRPHLYRDLAEGLRVTAPAVRPNIRGLTQPVRVASTMRARLSNPVWRQQHVPASRWQQPATAHQGGPRMPPAQQGWRQPPAQSFQQQGWRQPPQQQGWRQPPVRTQPPAWQRPQQQTWQRPQQQTWQPPATQRPIYTRPAYTPPAYRPPPAYNSRPSWNTSRPTYSPPTYHPTPTYTAPSHSWSGPSHSSPSYSAPSHSYSAPSHSSYGGGGGGHSYGGGGGRHR